MQGAMPASATRLLPGPSPMAVGLGLHLGLVLVRCRGIHTPASTRTRGQLRGRGLLSNPLRRMRGNLFIRTSIERSVSSGVSRQRTCPQDWTPLVSEERKTLLRKIQVDVCPKCQGIFLDRGEVKALTGQADLHRLLTKYLGLDADSQLLCPNCGGLMDGEDAGDVRVDVCLTCEGVWLDAGELERLATMDDAPFREFTPEKMEELLRANRIKQEDRKRAVRTLLRGLGRR